MKKVGILGWSLAIILAVIIVAPLVVDAVHVGADSPLHSLESVGEAYHGLIGGATYKADLAVERSSELLVIAQNNPNEAPNYLWLADTAASLLNQAKIEANSSDAGYIQSKQAECEDILAQVKASIPANAEQIDSAISSVRFRLG